MDEYRYELSSVEKSSHDYGNCEVCGKHCTEVFYQTEERKYKLPDEIAIERGEKYGWTYHKCRNYFGHKECLINKQRGENHV